MLQKLHIENYAIIDVLDIDFLQSLNIITGETGAGKSILMGALSLILGERADSSVLQQKEKKCIVEGFFKINNEAISYFLQQNDLDVDELLSIRREIAVNSKSRAFINDTPVSLAQLKELSIMLVDLHQQFDTLQLGLAGFQQQVLDALAVNGPTLQLYAVSFQQYIQCSNELTTLREQQAAANTKLDFNQFLFDELSEADLKENELEDLDAELKLLSNVEQIKQQLEAIVVELKESERPVIQQLKSLNTKLKTIETYHSQIAALVIRLQSTQLELTDIADELQLMNENVTHSAERIQLVNDRISLGYKLQKKHGVKSTAALLEIQVQLQNELSNIYNITDSIEQKERATNELLEKASQLALVISTNRRKAIPPFIEKVNGLLIQVGMPNARFMVDMLTFEKLSEKGSDKIEFLFDANIPAGKDEQAQQYEPLRKVASGGELSRLMLCIKSLVAKVLHLPTLIFDEIDTGISGEAAKQVGNIMQMLSGSHQLIAITHQPQIAARAKAHFFVYKTIQKDKIVTSVKLLNNDERIIAIAQMLSGEKPTAAALQNAREMVGN